MPKEIKLIELLTVGQKVTISNIRSTVKKIIDLKSNWTLTSFVFRARLTGSVIVIWIPKIYRR